MRGRFVLLSVLMLAMTLVACSGPGTVGKAQPRADAGDRQSATGTRSEHGQDESVVPAVPRPLNAKPFLSGDEICKIVNEDQAKQLGLSDPKVNNRTDTDKVISCDYADKKSIRGLSVGFTVGAKQGLRGIYRLRSRYDIWQSTKVKGYPAAFVSKSVKTDCAMFVGVTNNLAVQVTYRGGDGDGDDSVKKVCDRDKELAGMVISNLKLQK